MPAIRRLAADIPALWEAPTTTDADRKEILRQIVDRVVVDTQGGSERVRLEIQWAGGTKTQGEMIRPVRNFKQLTYYPQLCERIRALAAEGLQVRQIADRINAEGYRPPKRRETFGPEGVARFMHRLGLWERRSRSKDRTGLAQHEWWLPELALKLSIPEVTLYNWIRRGWVKARQQERAPRRWIVLADEEEIRRLRERHQRPLGFHLRRRWAEESNVRDSMAPGVIPLVRKES